MKAAKRLSRLLIFWVILLAVISSVLLAALGLQIATVLADRIKCWRPDYEMTDITYILQKEELSDDDYLVLFAQTGLTKIGVDRMLSHGSDGIDGMLKLQKQYFEEHEVRNELFAPFACSDYIDGNIVCTYLRDGDILVTSSTHIAGWRIGHSCLVTNGERREVLQATSYGERSGTGSANIFTNRVNFMVLSPKADESIKAEVVKYALEELIGKQYNAAAGILTSKYKYEKTQCAHLTWYAYYNFGIDLDSNGGNMVVPRDIANSPYVELVQVFGFDPIKLWS